MSIQEIKASGILEEFVFGNPSQAQITQVESWIKQYPELQSYVTELEQTAESLAIENAIQPPAEWKNEIISQATNNNHTNKLPSKSINWWTIAASFLIGGLLCSGIFYSKVHSLQSELEIAELKYQELAIDCENDKIQYAGNQDLIHYLQHENTKTITLVNTVANDKISVYWNDDQKRALAHIQQLNPIAANESYQMWADVNGEMISVGLLDAPSNQFFSISYLENAESLNITIEPKGGSEHPTVSRLVMSAKV